MEPQKDLPARSVGARLAAVTALAITVASGTTSLTLTHLAVLSAPLLLVPLGLALLCGEVPIGRRTLDLAAGSVVASAFMPVGALAALVAGGWLIATVCNLAIVATRWWRDPEPGVDGVAVVVACGWLPVAAGWFVASRGGLAPFGFAEPITLLTAAHFHVAGFALSAVTLTVVRRLHDSRWRNVAGLVLASVTLGPICIAVGFMTTPTLNMVGACIVAAGVFTLLPCIVVATTGARPAQARRAVRIAAVVPLVPLVLAVIYSLGPVLGTPMPSVELMVRAHGIVNALGFAGLALIGFTAMAPAEQPIRSHVPQEDFDAVPA